MMYSTKWVSIIYFFFFLDVRLFPKIIFMHTFLCFSLTHSFIQQVFIGASYISGLMHKATKINRTDISLCPPEVCNQLRGTDNK